MDRDNHSDAPVEAGPKPRRVLLHGDIRWGVTWGFLLVAIGLALLLDHMGVAPFSQLFRFWPLLLVLFGVMTISTQSGRGFGIVLIVLGVLLQLNALHIIYLSVRDFWPLAIIAVGILMIWGSIDSWTLRKPVQKTKVDWTKPGAAEEFRRQMEETYNDPNWLSAVAVFSGCERRFTGKQFQGGKAVSIFGGIELDFRDADMDEGEAVLEVNCVFGGVEIRVPPNWTVHARSLPVFGGFEDKSGRKGVVDPTQEPTKKTLVVTGVVVFGGVEISN